MPGGVFLQPPSNQIIILTQLKMNPPGLRVFFGVLTLVAVAVYQIIRRFLFAHHTAKRIIITGLRYAAVGVGFLYIIKEKHTLQTRANGVSFISSRKSTRCKRALMGAVGVGFLYIIKEKHALQTRANGGGQLRAIRYKSAPRPIQPLAGFPLLSLLRGVQSTIPARHNAGKARVTNVRYLGSNQFRNKWVKPFPESPGQTIPETVGQTYPKYSK